MSFNKWLNKKAKLIMLNRPRGNKNKLLMKNPFLKVLLKQLMLSIKRIHLLVKNLCLMLKRMLSIRKN